MLRRNLSLIVPAGLIIAAAFAQNGTVTAPLEERQWTLTEVEGEKASADLGRRIPYLEFAAGGDHLSGYDGCNRLMGTYQKNGVELKIHIVAETLMACMLPGNSLGPKLNDMFDKTTSYRIRGNTLTLLNEKTVLAEFEAKTKSQQNP